MADNVNEAPAEEVVEQVTEQPEVLYADKFKSVSELEKSYKELQSSYSKKLGAFNGAPEQYDSEDAPEFLTNWGKDNQLSNDGLGELVDNFKKYQEEQTTATVNKEMEKLGENAQERIKTVSSFLDANLGADHGFDVSSANGIESLEKLIAMSKQSTVAPVAAEKTYDRYELNQLRFAVDSNGERRMETDPAYRTKVEAIERKAWA